MKFYVTQKCSWTKCFWHCVFDIVFSPIHNFLPSDVSFDVSLEEQVTGNQMKHAMTLSKNTDVSGFELCWKHLG